MIHSYSYNFWPPPPRSVCRNP